MTRLLVVDDEEQFPRLVRALVGDAYTIDVARGAEEALQQLGEVPYDAVLTDLHMPPGPDGIELLRRARARDEGAPPFLVLTGHAAVETAVSAMREGAFDYLRKTATRDELNAAIDRAVEHGRMAREVSRLRREVSSQVGDRPVGESAAMKRVMALAERVAPSDASVLILGESGTGKELLARTIHRLSSRSQQPFVAFDCSALAPSLVESELFGHERGAFTGAQRARRGLFREASFGTLFLDEIGDVSPALQLKLLRVLQEREFEPLGSERTVKVDVRIIAATNRDLRQLVAEGKFQEDLFYRLNVIPITIPPLRERPEDIPLLVEHFVRRHASRAGKRVDSIAPDAMALLAAAPWPGNVRELENTIERAVVLTPEPVIRPRDVMIVSASAPGPTGLPSMLLKQNLEWTERETVRRALDAARWVKKDAAEAMGISQRALSYYLAKHRIDAPD
jgi:DNA-binding NtrC family response regulator